MTATDPTALEHWGTYDRDNPFPLFESVRRAGPVHDVTLADGHRAFLVLGYAAADTTATESATLTPLRVVITCRFLN